MKSASSGFGQRTRAIALPFLAFILTFTWLGLAGDTTAEEIKDPKLVASDVLPGSDHKPPVAKVSEEEATQIALKAVPGEVTSVSIERKRGHNVYVVEIIAKEDGVETDVFVDIESGKVVGIDK
jgi:uncharacterized membrane protein YkoI